MCRKPIANHGPGGSLALWILVGVLASAHSGLAQRNPPQGCLEKPPAGVTTKPINGPNGPIGSLTTTVSYTAGVQTISIDSKESEPPLPPGVSNTWTHSVSNSCNFQTGSWDVLFSTYDISVTYTVGITSAGRDTDMSSTSIFHNFKNSYRGTRKKRIDGLADPNQIRAVEWSDDFEGSFETTDPMGNVTKSSGTAKTSGTHPPIKDPAQPGNERTGPSLAIWLAAIGDGSIDGVVENWDWSGKRESAQNLAQADLTASYSPNKPFTFDGSARPPEMKAKFPGDIGVDCFLEGEPGATCQQIGDRIIGQFVSFFMGLRQGGVPSPDEAYATQLSNHFIQIPDQWR